MNKHDFNLNVLVEMLGEYKIEGDERVFKCPYCVDTHRDNMKFNVKKNVITCFADDSHSKRFVSEYYKYLNNSKVSKPFFKQNIISSNNDISLDNERQKQFVRRNFMSNQELLNSSEYLKNIFDERKISKDTVLNCKIGLNLKRKRYEFPIFKFNPFDSTNSIVSFEFRPLDLSKNGICRERNTPTGLAQINTYTENTRYLVIIGGFIDGYSLFQCLKENKKEQYFHIVTSSNGENTTLKYLQKLDNPQDILNRYKKVFIFLDNDLTGMKEAEKIQKEYQNTQIVKFNCACKDFNEHYVSGCTHLFNEFEEV